MRTSPRAPADTPDRASAPSSRNAISASLLGDDDVTADRNYIKEFSLTHSRELGKQYGVEYAEAFHYIAPGAAGADRDPRIDTYVKEHAVLAK